MLKTLGLTAAAIGAAMAVLLAAVTALTAAEPDPATAAAAGGQAVGDIPPAMLVLYQGAAATCPGLPWPVLAAIGKIESDHGRSTAPGVHTGENSAGAGGTMQFLAGTWAAYGVDGDGDGVADRYDDADAIYSAARYLCANGAGAPDGLNAAIFAYNHADWYVRQVLAQAAAYTAATPTSAAVLLADPRLTMSPAARADLTAGVVDPRLIATLAALLPAHRLYLSVIKAGHSEHVAGTDRVSNHAYGRAADIAAVDGQPVTRANLAARDLVLQLEAMTFPGRRPEIGQPWPDLVGHGVFTDANHRNHIHVGFFASAAGCRWPPA